MLFRSGIGLITDGVDIVNEAELVNALPENMFVNSLTPNEDDSKLSAFCTDAVAVFDVDVDDMVSIESVVVSHCNSFFGLNTSSGIRISEVLASG